MRTIREMAKPLPGLLGCQRLTPGEPYRLLHFVVQQPVDEGLLLYNVLTKAVVVLDPEEGMGESELHVHLRAITLAQGR